MARLLRPFTTILLFATIPTLRAQISLYTTVDQALRNSTAVRMAATDVQKAEAALRETKDVYVPSFALGSAVGYSYGFPLGQPSVLTVTSQSLIFNFSQLDYVRAARARLTAAQLALEDARQQVILDTALDYIQLDTDQRRIDAIAGENEAATRLAFIEQQRLDAGIGTRADLLHARLIAAQLRLKRLHIENDAVLLRERLAHLTGLPADGIVPQTQSIPPAPDTVSQGGSLASLAAMNTQGVQSAYAISKSRTYLAFGDARQNLRPTFAFGGQYSRYAKFNNYQDYYRRFQHNNFEIGLQINIPLYDVSKRAKEQESLADAAHAAAQADQVRDQAGENIVQIQKSLTELAAQKEIAQLQSEIAQANLDAVLTQLNNPPTTPGATPLAPADEQQARIEERRRFGEALDATFELTKAQLSLLRALGTIETWYKTQPTP